MPRPSLREHDATLTAQAIARIRRDVLVGNLGPASKLRVRELSKRYDLGVTPVREALATLGAEGLVHPIYPCRPPPMGAGPSVSVVNLRVL